METGTDQAQRAVEELVAHYQAKARAVSRASVAIGAGAGVLVGAIPLSPLRAAWPIPSQLRLRHPPRRARDRAPDRLRRRRPAREALPADGRAGAPPAPARAAHLAERHADGAAPDRADRTRRGRSAASRQPAARTRSALPSCGRAARPGATRPAAAQPEPPAPPRPRVQVRSRRSRHADPRCRPSLRLRCRAAALPRRLAPPLSSSPWRPRSRLPPQPVCTSPSTGGAAVATRAAGAPIAGAAPQAVPAHRRSRRRLALALRVAVGARLVDERAEERRVLALLRVPEHADGEPLAGILDRLERAVLGPGRLDEPVADAAEALVVVRLDRRPLAEQRAEPALRPSRRPRGRRTRRACACASRRRRPRGDAGRGRRPRATFSTCEPRQTASTGMSRSSAARQERQLAAVALRPDAGRLRDARRARTRPDRCPSRRRRGSRRARRASRRSPRRSAARAARARRPPRPAARTRAGSPRPARPRRPSARSAPRTT